ncbi:MAG: TatD family hydrolase [Prevotellaceae bacterium]|jgi:TatD DNase family protein|nr:TatD family hydrolase [Prevotellaceae bacterium]
MYIDTHTHLFAKEFDNDRDEVIRRAQEAGVERFILPDIELSSFEVMMKLAEKYPCICLPTIGLHPTSVNAENYKAELDFVHKTIDKHKFAAVGEIGIDCYWTMDYVEQQRIVFEAQLRMAAERDLPVIIHARNSFHEIFAILDKLMFLNIRGVFHSFSGTHADYEKIKSYKNFKIGIGGIVSFKNGGIAGVVENIPLDDIVLETDSPYLAPVPYRGKRNESAYIPLIVRKIAEIKGVKEDTLARYTADNARELFGIA